MFRRPALDHDQRAHVSAVPFLWPTAISAVSGPRPWPPWAPTDTWHLEDEPEGEHMHGPAAKVEAHEQFPISMA